MRDNIEAIRTAFTLDREGRTPTERERVLLGRYCGFGGLKCILNPARELTDAVHWAKSDLELFAPTVELHRIIRENSRDDMEYKRYTDSLKASVLTAFYTPQTITDTIAEVLHDRKVRPRLVLEPSAGMGAFISPVLSNNLQAEVMAFEKDLLTGKMLGHLYPQQKIRTEGFEKIEKPFLNRFDLAISNIPFGDIAVFDAEYEKKSVMHRIAAKKVHTYFFLKGLDAVRDGGVVAFITSQSVLNTEGNGGTRYLMMKQADLLSAIRLPNNLFTENANTEVGCDLIILQKNINKMDLSEEDMRFTRTVRSNHTGVVTNEYFLDHPERIIHTEAKKDTDPYGKPAMIYTHNGGVEGIAMDLYKMLSEDLSVRLDLERYNGIKGERQEARQEMRQNIAVQTEGIETKRENSASVAEERTEVKKESGLPDAGAADRTKREANSVQPKVQAMTGVSQEAQSRHPEAPVMDLYDLFGYTQEERRLAERGLKPERKKGSKSKPKKPVQASLFVLPEDGTGMEADKGKTEAGAAITPEEAKEMEEIIRGTAEVEA
ncbi:N-6 DNA methylase, partial [Phocaeicola vulgatus]